jgi:hypothetical protein
MGCLYSRPLIDEEEQIIKCNESSIPFHSFSFSQFVQSLSICELKPGKDLIPWEIIESSLCISLDIEDSLTRYFNQYFTIGTQNLKLLIVAAVLYSKMSESEKAECLYTIYADSASKMTIESVGKLIVDIIDISVDKCIGLIVECTLYDPRSIKVRSYLQKLKYIEIYILKIISFHIIQEHSEIPKEKFVETLSKSAIRQILSPSGMRKYLRDLEYRSPSPFECW